MRSYSFHFQTDISINPFLFLNIQKRKREVASLFFSSPVENPPQKNQNRKPFTEFSHIIFREMLLKMSVAHALYFLLFSFFLFGWFSLSRGWAIRDYRTGLRFSSHFGFGLLVSLRCSCCFAFPPLLLSFFLVNTFVTVGSRRCL